MSRDFYEWIMDLKTVLAMYVYTLGNDYTRMLTTKCKSETAKLFYGGAKLMEMHYLLTRKINQKYAIQYFCDCCRLTFLHGA